MKLFLALLALIGAASAFVTPSLAASHAATRAAASPTMACNGGKGGRGGKSPPKDKNRRGKLGRLIQAVRVFYFAYIAARSLSFLVSFLARHTPCFALVSLNLSADSSPVSYTHLTLPTKA